MCDECHQHPHATMCPNGTPMVDVIHVDCALCGAEVDEETTMYGICEKCWTRARTFDNAIKYGETSKVKVEINGLYAKAFTPEQIDRALVNAMNCIRSSVAGYKFAEQMVQSFLGDDTGDFADWLVEQKKGKK